MKIFGLINKKARNNQQADQLNLKGIEFAKMAKYDLARQYFEQSISLAPDSPHAHICLSSVFIDQELYPPAEAELRLSLTLNLDNKTKQDALTNLAIIRIHMKDFNEARDLLQEAMSLYPPDKGIYNNAALCYFKLGEWNLALKYYRCSNDALRNVKAQCAMEIVKQTMWQSTKAESILNSDDWLNIQYPKCEMNSLEPHEFEIINKALCNDKSLLFFVGAGISYPEPSCLPLASQVIDNIFHMFFCLDGNSIKQILDLTEDSSEDQVYSKLCSDLWKQKHLPFEPSFQALFEIYGFSAIRFVDLLSGGEPNLHHKMLAYALHKGHSIITTNFDQQIERAFSSSFPGENLKILITDLDYQEALDKQHFNGVLAKIHGDMKKYNSLALTTEQIAVSNDKTVWVGRDISPEKGKRQLGQVYPLSSLSVPKALFLQTIISTKSTVIMGYSGSDVFDIMPILVTPEFNSHGLWVNHGINTNADPWLTKGSDRFLLQPLTKKDESFDITSKVSKYFLELFGGNYYSDNTGEQSPPLTSEDFVVWAKRLGIREGDGLSLIATLYIQMGKWYEAHLFYKEAMKKYAENLEFSENRLLWAKTSMAYALRNLGRKEAAVSIAMEIKNYIEKNGKENLYASIYSTVLLNLASELPGTDCDADSSLEKALSIDETTKSKRTACFAKRITAKRHFERGEYQQALEFWLQAMKIAIDETGDLNEAYSSSLGAGECYVKMGDFYSALQLTNNAINYAKQMQDETAIERANLNYASIFSYFQGDSPTSVYHNMFIESAMDAIGPKRAEEIKVAMQYTQNGSYDHAITIINRLLNSYKNAEILAFLFFLRSNIYHRKGEWLMDIESLNKSNSVKTNNPLVECNLGIAYIMTSNLAIAEKHLSKAIDLVGGNYPLAICYIGIVYAKQNKLQEAKVQLSRAEKLHSPEYFLGELRQAIARI